MKLELAVFLLGYLVCTATATDEHEHEHGGDEGHDGTDHTDHRMINVTTIIYPPYVMEKDGHFEGLAIDLLEELAHRVHFNYRIHEVKDGKWGSRDSMGNWDGMIGELLSGKADLAVAPLTITARRRSKVRMVELSDDALTAVVHQDSGIDTLEELLKTNITIGSSEGSRERIQTSTQHIVLNSRIKNSEVTMDFTKALDKVRKGGYAFIMDSSVAKYRITLPPCTLKTTNSFLPEDAGQGFAVRMQLHDFVEELDEAANLMRKDHVISDAEDEWIPEECSGASSVFKVSGVLMSVVAALWLYL